MRKFNQEGMLEYTDDGRYVLDGLDISAILKEVYYSDKSNAISFRINKGCRTLFNEEGTLLIRMSEEANCIYGYHINGEDLETKLFNTVGNVIGVELAWGM